MATKNIKLEESTAKKLYPTATPEFKALLEESFTKEFFSERIIDRIKNFNDILNELDETEGRILPWASANSKRKKSQNALAKIQLITEVYNGAKEEDWTDWSNTSQPKYYIWWKKGARGWVVDWVDVISCCGACVPAGCYFKERAHAEDASVKFKDIFIDFLPE